MDGFNADRLKATLDLFILRRFSDQRAFVSFEISTARKADTHFVRFVCHPQGQAKSRLAAEQRLHRDGWLKAEPKPDEGMESELVYSLAVVGEQRVKEESARLESMLCQFVEHGGMDKSLRKFLDRRRPVGDN